MIKEKFFKININSKNNKENTFNLLLAVVSN